jgi:YidC/Oxa1 family membrane protein insertase
MNFDKKTIIAFILIGLVFFLVQTPIYKKMFMPRLYEAEMAKKQGRTLDLPIKADSFVTKQSDAFAPVAQEKPSAPEIDRVNSLDSYGIQKAERERLITIETDLYRARFSSKGAVLREWALKKYLGPDGQIVQMLPEGAAGVMGLSFVSKEGDSLDTSFWSFSCESDSEIVLHGGESKTVRFECKLSGEGRIVKEFQFFPDRYDFQMQVDLENMGDLIAEKAYSINAPSGLASTEKRLEDDMSYAKAVVAAGGVVNKKYPTDLKVHKETGDIDWIAVRTKYFSLAIVAKDRKGMYASIVGEEHPVANERKHKWKKYAASLTMPFLRARGEKDRFLVYLGPLDDDILKSYGIGLEKIMDFGAKIIQPFSIAILWTFKEIHKFIPNYGWVLIIFSVLIKIVTYPLTRKSFDSMKKMQALQPKMADLKEKYSKDPQRLNKETMKLYKEEGVNPMGGCLPVLLQMPLLWGLFIVFRSTIELRSQGFVWWIKDLSSPDTVATLPFSLPFYGDMVNVLPIIMGVTMLIQQKMSVTDPKQKAMIYFMPIFFTLLFNSFPAGLNLYYALFNILSIIHQKWQTRDQGSNTVPAVVKEIKRQK